jgi:hypothetical protein
MADAEISVAEAREAIAQACLPPNVKLDWFSIALTRTTRYDSLGRSSGPEECRWVIRSSLKDNKTWHSPQGSAPLLRQALAQWRAELQHATQMQAQFIDGRGATTHAADA